MSSRLGLAKCPTMMVFLDRRNPLRWPARQVARMRNLEATRLELSRMAPTTTTPSRRLGSSHRDDSRSRPRLHLTPSLGEDVLEVRALPASLTVAPLIAPSSPTFGVGLDETTTDHHYERAPALGTLPGETAVRPEALSWWKLDGQGNHVIWYGESADQMNPGLVQDLLQPDEWIQANTSVAALLKTGEQFVWNGQLGQRDDSDRYLLRLTDLPEAMTLAVNSPLNLTEHDLCIRVTMRTWDGQVLIDQWVQGFELAASKFELAQEFVNVLGDTPPEEWDWIQLQIAIEPINSANGEDGAAPTGGNPNQVPPIAPVDYEMSLRISSAGSSFVDKPGSSQVAAGSESLGKGNSSSLENGLKQPDTEQLAPPRPGRSLGRGEDGSASLNGTGFVGTDFGGETSAGTSATINVPEQEEFTGRRRVRPLRPALHRVLDHERHRRAAGDLGRGRRVQHRGQRSGATTFGRHTRRRTGRRRPGGPMGNSRGRRMRHRGGKHQSGDPRRSLRAGRTGVDRGLGLPGCAGNRRGL